MFSNVTKFTTILKVTNAESIEFSQNPPEGKKADRKTGRRPKRMTFPRATEATPSAKVWCSHVFKALAEWERQIRPNELCIYNLRIFLDIAHDEQILTNRVDVWCGANVGLELSAAYYDHWIVIE